MFRHGVFAVEGDVGDGNVALCACVHINMIVAGGHGHDEFEVWKVFQDIFCYMRVNKDTERVNVFYFCYDLWGEFMVEEEERVSFKFFDDCFFFPRFQFEEGDFHLFYVHTFFFVF